MNRTKTPLALAVCAALFSLAHGPTDVPTFLDRFAFGLAASAVVGSVAPRHLSFMGSITAPGRLQRETAVAAADVLVADAVDIALLAPV